MFLDFLEDHQIAALIILPVAGSGMVINWFIATFIGRLKTLKNPFGLLTRSQSIGEAIHNTVFTLYVVPMLFFDIDWMKENSRFSGTIILIAYDIGIWSHFIISINRIIRNTKIAICILWIGTIVPAYYFYTWTSPECNIFFKFDFYRYTFTQNDLCFAIIMYFDLMKYIIVVIIIAIIDSATLIKVHLVNIEMRSRTSTRFSRRKRLEEVNFLKQACMQAFCFLCELICYFFLEPAVENKWMKFALSTMTFVSLHFFDGLITVSFNREFRTLLPCYTQSNAIQTPSYPSRGTTHPKRTTGANSAAIDGATQSGGQSSKVADYDSHMIYGAHLGDTQQTPSTNNRIFLIST